MGPNIAKLPNVNEQQHTKHIKSVKKRELGKNTRNKSLALNSSSVRQAQYEGVDFLACNLFIPEVLCNSNFALVKNTASLSLRILEVQTNMFLYECAHCSNCFLLL